MERNPKNEREHKHVKIPAKTRIQAQALRWGSCKQIPLFRSRRFREPGRSEGHHRCCSSRAPPPSPERPNTAWRGPRREPARGHRRQPSWICKAHRASARQSSKIAQTVAIREPRTLSSPPPPSPARPERKSSSGRVSAKGKECSSGTQSGAPLSLYQAFVIRVGEEQRRERKKIPLLCRILQEGSLKELQNGVSFFSPPRFSRSAANNADNRRPHGGFTQFWRLAISPRVIGIIAPHKFCHPRWGPNGHIIMMSQTASSSA